MGAPPSTIVVGVDGSPSATLALDWAIEQAVAEQRGLTLVHALGNLPAAWTDIGLADPQAMFTAMEREGRRILDEAEARVTDRASTVPVTRVLEFVDARTLLLREAEHAALVVLGSRGRGPIASLLLGSVSAAVARHARCPVIIHRPTERGRVRNGILVATDAGPESQLMLEFAFHLASVRRLPLTVLHCQWDVETMGRVAVDLPGEDAETARLELAESLAGMDEKYPDVHVTKTVVTGPPEARVNKAADKMDLLVVGTHRRPRTGRFLYGSVAMSLLEHAQVTIAVVPIPAGP